MWKCLTYNVKNGMKDCQLLSKEKDFLVNKARKILKKCGFILSKLIDTKIY